MNSITRKYLNAVRRKLPMRDMRERITQSLRLSCESFETEHPNADRKMYCAHFGTPEQIGINALQSCDPNDICLAIKRNRKAKIVSLSVFATIVLLMVGICMYFCHEVYQGTHGCFVETSSGITVLSSDDLYLNNNEKESEVHP